MPSIIYLYLSLLLLLTSTSREEHVILFSSQRNGNSDIFLMDGNGENIVQLTNSPDEEWGATWINKSTISFLRDDGTAITRHRFDLDSMGETELNHPPNCVLDDKNAVYLQEEIAQAYTCKGDIFLLRAGSSTPVNLTKSLDGICSYISMGEGGQSIIFTNDSAGNNDIYRLDLSNGTISAIVDDPANDERGALSPDGEHLAWSSNRYSDNQDILIMDLETDFVRNITSTPGQELIARWSSDGSTIYYGGQAGGNWEIFSYHLVTGRTIRLTNNNTFDGDPRPDPLY